MFPQIGWPQTSAGRGFAASDMRCGYYRCCGSAPRWVVEPRIPGLPPVPFDVRFGALRMTRPLVVTLLCLTALAVAFAASAAFTTACTTHQCDTDFTNIDMSTGTTVGSMQILDPTTPSPRALDELDVEIRGNDVYVRFENFRAGIKEKVSV